MKGRTFVDTNIVVYCFDASEPSKKDKASHVITELSKSNRFVISYQVIQEFMNVSLHKFKKQFNYTELTEVVRELNDLGKVVPPSIKIFEQALHIHTEYQLGFYDALIVAAACESKCENLLTEDMQDNQTILGVTIRNPFT